jgi:hypothetical protein
MASMSGKSSGSRCTSKQVTSDVSNRIDVAIDYSSKRQFIAAVESDGGGETYLTREVCPQSEEQPKKLFDQKLPVEPPHRTLPIVRVSDSWCN